MDSFWTDVATYVGRAAEANARILGPAGFAPALTLIEPAQPFLRIGDVDVVILHKTDFEDLPPQLVSDALKSFTVGFANEVFVVLAREPRVVEADEGHLGALDQIRAWSRADYHDGKGHAITPRVGARMAACYMGQGRVLLQTAFGHLMLVMGEDTSITPHLVRDGWFDFDLTSLLTRTLKPGQTFVDVGANFGTYALVAAEIVGIDGRILAVEANPAIAEVLHENLVMNGFGERGTVLRNAAGASAGMIEMFAFSIRQGGSTMMAEVAQRAEADYSERVLRQHVPVRTLDEMVEAADLQAIDLLKIDVEGYEAPVLEGAIGCIERFRPKLLLEWHPSFISADAANDMYRLLTQRSGYRLRRVEAGGTTRAIEFDELMNIPHSDVLAVPLT